MSYPFIFLSCILADYGYDLVRDIVGQQQQTHY